MSHYKLLVIFLYVINICDIRISAGKNSSNVHHLNLRRKLIEIEHGRRQFPAPSTDRNGDIFELFFGVLLPVEPAKVGCTYIEVLPAMELAIKKLQQPGGLFENYSICIEYRDTKPSSIHGTIAAFGLYTKQFQGYF